MSRLARSGRHLLIGLTVAAAAAAAASLTAGPRALAYPAPGYAATLTAGCTTTARGQLCPMTFTLTQSNGQPASGVAAQFTTQPCGTVTPSSATTNSQGQVALTFSAGQSCCGTVTVTGTAPSVGVIAQTQVNVTCPGLLPATGATPPAGSSAAVIGALTVLFIAAAGLLAGAAGLLRQRRLIR